MRALGLALALAACASDGKRSTVEVKECPVTISSEIHEGPTAGRPEAPNEQTPSRN